MEITYAHGATAAPTGINAIGAGPDRLCGWLLRQIDIHRRGALVTLLFVYLLGFNAQWRIERDSALYLSVGRNLADGQGYTFRGGAHQLAYPGLPILCAATFRALGTRSVAPVLIIIFLFGAATLALIYRLFDLYAGRPTAILVTVGVGLTRLFYRYNFEVLSDLPFLMGVMACLAGFEAIFGRASRHGAPGNCAETEMIPGRGERTLCPGASDDRASLAPRWYDWALLLGGLATCIAMRPAMWALLLTLATALVWGALRGSRRRSQVVLMLLLIAAGGALYQFLRAGASGLDEYQEFVFNNLRHVGPLIQHLRENITVLFTDTLVKAMFGCRMWTALNVAMGVVIMLVGVGLLSHRVIWGLWFILTVIMLLLFKPLDRYFLPVLPLLVFGWWRLLVRLNFQFSTRWGNWVFAALFLCGMGTNMARIGELIAVQRQMPFLAHYHGGRYESTTDVARLIGEHAKKGQWVLSEARTGRILTYLSGTNVFEATDSLPHDHVTRQPLAPSFVLRGPPWSDAGESRPADDPGERRGAELQDWLSAHPALRLGAPVGPPIQGPHDSRPWLLYPVEVVSPASAPSAMTRSIVSSNFSSATRSQ